MHRLVRNYDAVAVGIQVLAGANLYTSEIQHYPFQPDTIVARAHGCGTDGLYAKVQVAKLVLIANATVYHQAFPSMLLGLCRDIAATKGAAS